MSQPDRTDSFADLSTRCRRHISCNKPAPPTLRMNAGCRQLLSPLHLNDGLSFTLPAAEQKGGRSTERAAVCTAAGYVSVRAGGRIAGESPHKPRLRLRGHSSIQYCFVWVSIDAANLAYISTIISCADCMCRPRRQLSCQIWPMRGALW